MPKSRDDLITSALGEMKGAAIPATGPWRKIMRKYAAS
jgi:hypothetical protein